MLSVYRDRLLDFIGTRSAFPDDSSSRRTIERYRMSDAGFDRPSVCNNGAGQHSRIFFSFECAGVLNLSSACARSGMCPPPRDP